MMHLRKAFAAWSTMIPLMMLLVVSGVRGEEVDAKAIVAKTLANYAKIETYQAEGKSVTVMNQGGSDMTLESTFTIKLGRPSLYCINWKGMMGQKGAVWNAGEGPFLFMGMGKEYSKMTSDGMALAAATGISSGAANTIPSMFFPESRGSSVLSQLTELAFVKMEALEGEECYVISGKSKVFPAYTLWISKERSLLIRAEHSMDLPAGADAVPDLTDEQLDAGIKASGGKPTDATRKQLRATMKRAAARVQGMKGTSTETHSNIQINAKLEKEAFAFPLPEGAILKDSPF